MAAAIQSFCITAGKPLSRLASKRQPLRSIGRRRCFKTISPRQRDDADKETSTSTMSSGELGSSDPTNPPPISKELDDALIAAMKDHGGVRQVVSRALQEFSPFREIPLTKPKKEGALNMGMEPAEEPEEDPEFEGDDITSIAHGQLEQHREYRHYARLAAWEMPLLTKMAKDFVPPTEKEVLRFRYTSYMGEQHPAEKKVVVEFCPADMRDLTDVQRDKLRKLSGSRWNPETDIIKTSCEMFETQAQNKRYLGDLVETLLKEARDPTDTFEDVPLDTRHHRFKVKPKFPTAWRMTDERRAELETFRQRTALTDEQKAVEGVIVDGVERIQAALASPPRKREGAAEAQMIMAGRTAGRDKRSKLR